MSKQVAIIGGGLAGLAAAVVLASEGYDLTLIERRPFLGGRASSYPFPQSGSTADTTQEDVPRQPVDNCQHILMRCCNNLLDFCFRLGIQEAIQFYDRYVFLDANGNRATLKGTLLPAPFHMLPSFLSFSALRPGDKLAIMRAFLAMMRQQHQLESLDRMSMLEWLQEQRQPEHAIETFWQVILVSALNENAASASARYGIKVFLDGMLKRPDSFHLGVPARPLSELYATPALELLKQHKAQVQLRTSAAKFEIEGAKVSGIRLKDGGTLQANYYISAVPGNVLAELLPAEFLSLHANFSTLKQISYSPTTAIHLWFDREITTLDNAAFLGKRIHWLFKKPPNKKNGWPVSLVVSASHDLLPMERNQILEIALTDLRSLFPLAREARLLDGQVIKEPSATFSCHPGVDACRLDQHTPVENLFLAGDWTNTGWPATMEGAVHSGYRAAELLCEAEGRPRAFLQPDLPPTGLAKWLLR